MSQQTLALFPVTPTTENWDATLHNALVAMRGAMRSFRITLFVQGSTATPSQVVIQLLDGAGNNLSEQVFVRVRITDFWLNAGNAVMAVNSGTVVETETTSKDLVIKTTATGSIIITCTCSVAQFFAIVLGKAPLMPAFADYSATLTIAHAIPAPVQLRDGNSNALLTNGSGAAIYPG